MRLRLPPGKSMTISDAACTSDMQFLLTAEAGEETIDRISSSAPSIKRVLKTREHADWISAVVAVYLSASLWHFAMQSLSLLFLLPTYSSASSRPRQDGRQSYFDGTPDAHSTTPTSTVFGYYRQAEHVLLIASRLRPRCCKPSGGSLCVEIDTPSKDDGVKLSARPLRWQYSTCINRTTHLAYPLMYEYVAHTPLNSTIRLYGCTFGLLPPARTAMASSASSMSDDPTDHPTSKIKALFLCTPIIFSPAPIMTVGDVTIPSPLRTGCNTDKQYSSSPWFSLRIVTTCRGDTMLSLK